MIDDALPPNSTFDGDKRDCPRTTPEARAELRRRYGSPPTGVLRCLVCREMMELVAPKAERIGVLWTWRCPRASEHPLLHHIDHYGDLDVLALCDDADALAGALAERDDAMEAQENAWRNVNLLTERLGAERTALHEDVARLRAALSWLVREARGYLDIEADTSEEDLAAALTHAATVLHALAGPATESPQNTVADSHSNVGFDPIARKAGTNTPEAATGKKCRQSTEGTADGRTC